VNYDTGSIELARLEKNGIDLLALYASFFGLVGERSDLISYMWPGNDDATWRYNPVSLLI